MTASQRSRCLVVCDQQSRFEPDIVIGEHEKVVAVEYLADMIESDTLVANLDMDEPCSQRGGRSCDDFVCSETTAVLDDTCGHLIQIAATTDAPADL